MDNVKDNQSSDAVNQCGKDPIAMALEAANKLLDRNIAIVFEEARLSFSSHSQACNSIAEARKLIKDALSSIKDQQAKPVECDHQFSYFGDQVKARRCVRCDKLEHNAQPVEQIDSPAGELPAKAWVPNLAFAADGWANVAYNGLQHLRNIQEGITTPESAIENMEQCCAAAQADWRQALQAEREANNRPANPVDQQAQPVEQEVVAIEQVMQAIREYGNSCAQMQAWRTSNVVHSRDTTGYDTDAQFTAIRSIVGALTRCDTKETAQEQGRDDVIDRAIKFVESWPLNAENMQIAERYAKHDWNNAVASVLRADIVAGLRQLKEPHHGK